MGQTSIAAALASFLCLCCSAAEAGPCDVKAYRAQDGLTAEVNDNGVVATWAGAAPGSQMRAVFVLQNGAPLIRELASRGGNGTWTPILRDVAPDFRLVSGLRRITDQQLEPLKKLGTPITQAVIDRYKWEAFWDAPLQVGGNPKYPGPPKDGVGDQPGLPRSPAEIHHSVAAYAVQGCVVKTEGLRLEVSFPGVTLAPFSGRLQYTFYKGTNLIRQEVIAKTDLPSVAYKYDAGLDHIAAGGVSAVWRDPSGAVVTNSFGGGRHTGPVPVQTQTRLLALQAGQGAIAFFPPPHNFFWAREISTNLGYNWYRKDADGFVAAGVRQADAEAGPGQSGRGIQDFRDNFALYSAPPGSWQHMAVYLLVQPGDGLAAIDAARAYTRSDHYKALRGYQVMLAHVHAYFVRRLKEAGRNLDDKPADFDAVKAAGVNIFAPIDGGAGGRGTPPSPDEYLSNLGILYELARRHSDRDFTIMPNLEITEGELPDLVTAMGGHWDLQMPHPVYYAQGRAPGQSLVEQQPKRGKVYRLGSAEDVTEMMHREGIIAFMPHPRSKGSTGYPDAIKDTPRFKDESFRGIGYRWGMGLDRSEIRLCDNRCLTTLDDMNNWVANAPTPPKYLQAISELYQQGAGDEIYANTPVNYLHLDRLPEPGNWQPIVDTLRKGDYFVSSGEVLIPRYAIARKGPMATITADVEWTFPLEFAEIVWGDGKTTGRRIIPATDLPAFGSKHFEFPLDLKGKTWIRFAVWDSAGNGALVQPVKVHDLK